MKNVIKFTVGIAISILFLYLAIKGIAWQNVGKVLKEASYFFILPAILIHFISFLLRAAKWSMITSKIKKVKTLELFPLVTIGLAMNNILPLRAGEFGRIFLLSKKFDISPVDAGITIVLERIFDIVGLIGVVLIFIHLHKWPGMVNILISSATIFIVLFLVITPLLLYYSKTILSLSIINKYLDIPIFSKIATQILGAKDTYFKFHDIKLLLSISLLSMCLWVLEGLSYYVLSFVFNMHISLVDFIFVCAIVNLSSAIPSSPGFIGTFEFFTTTLLIFLGVSKTLALSYTLILHVELLLPVTIVGIIYYFGKRYDSYLSLGKVIENYETT